MKLHAWIAAAWMALAACTEPAPDDVREPAKKAVTEARVPQKPEPRPAVKVAGGQRVRRTGYSLVMPEGWTEDRDNKEMLVMNGKGDDAFMVQRAPIPLAINGEGACQKLGPRWAKASAMQFESSAYIVDERLGRGCRIMATKDGTRMLTSAFNVAGTGDMILAHCDHDVKLARPPAYCGEILATLVIE